MSLSFDATNCFPSAELLGITRWLPTPSFEVQHLATPTFGEPVESIDEMLLRILPLPKTNDHVVVSSRELIQEDFMDDRVNDAAVENFQHVPQPYLSVDAMQDALLLESWPSIGLEAQMPEPEFTQKPAAFSPVQTISKRSRVKKSNRCVASIAQHVIVENEFGGNPYPTTDRLMELVFELNACSDGPERNLRQVRKMFDNLRNRKSSVRQGGAWGEQSVGEKRKPGRPALAVQ